MVLGISLMREPSQIDRMEPYTAALQQADARKFNQ